MRLNEITNSEDATYDEIAYLIKKYFFLQQEVDQLKEENEKERKAWREATARGDDPDHFREMAFTSVRDTGYTIGHESAKQFMAKYPRREWYNVLRRKLYTSSTHMPKAMVDKLVEFNKQKQMINVTIEHLYRQLGISIPL